MEKIYTIKQFAKALNVHPQTLRLWDKKGTLKPIKLPSGHRRYSQEMLNNLLNNKLLAVKN